MSITNYIVESIVKDLFEKAFQEGLEIELMFSKGHLSPLQRSPVKSERNDGEESNTDDDVGNELENVRIFRCENQCDLKEFVMQEIVMATILDTREEQVERLFHIGQHLLDGVNKAQSIIDRYAREGDTDVNTITDMGDELCLSSESCFFDSA